MIIFVRLHRERPAHAGIVVCTFEIDFPSQARRIHDVVLPILRLAGQLLRVNRPA